ncbi:hypothetical protein NKG05_19145 [Oerskovia sp. M15]
MVPLSRGTFHGPDGSALPAAAWEPGWARSSRWSPDRSPAECTGISRPDADHRVGPARPGHPGRSRDVSEARARAARGGGDRRRAPRGAPPARRDASGARRALRRHLVGGRVPRGSPAAVRHRPVRGPRPGPHDPDLAAPSGPDRRAGL